MLKVDQIIEGDSIKVLNDQPEGWVDLVFADPPFNIGYLYHNYNDTRNTDDYLKFSEDWMRAVHRALKPNGSFFLAIGDEYAADLCVIARRQIGFNLRNWIIWHYTFGQHMKAKFARSHTHILYFTKSETDFTFNADAVRVASARQLIYADSRANPKGKVPDDTWYLRPQETDGEYFQPESSVWNVSRVCGTFKEREGWHGCQMPIAVLDRIIRSASNPGDLVLDPFNGSGTTIISAALHKRHYIGIDQSAEYVGFARQRLEHALKQAKAIEEARTGVGEEAAKGKKAEDGADHGNGNGRGNGHGVAKGNGAAHGHGEGHGNGHGASHAGAKHGANRDAGLLNRLTETDDVTLVAEVHPQAIFAANRPSRVMTPTDSLGRPRVKRGPRKTKAV